MKLKYKLAKEYDDSVLKRNNGDENYGEHYYVAGFEQAQMMMLEWFEKMFSIPPIVEYLKELGEDECD